MKEASSSCSYNCRDANLEVGIYGKIFEKVHGFGA